VIRHHHHQTEVNPLSKTSRWLGTALVVLGGAVAACAVLGPLLLEVIAYRTSATSLNQIIGADAAALFVVVPVTFAAAWLVLTGREGGALLGLAPAVFAAYTYTQLIVGNEYLARPGNVEKFFPMLLGVFILAVAVAMTAWRAASDDPLPTPSRRANRVGGVILLVIAAFIVIGLHVPTYLDALSDDPTNVGYLSSPTAFWLVKFMDLGIVAPAALVVGVGMLRGAAWARRPMYALVGGYALLAASVAGMAITMYVTDDPDSSPAMVAASVIAAVIMSALATYLYRPVLRRAPRAPRPVAANPADAAPRTLAGTQS
jgi:hypothetical protein